MISLKFYSKDGKKLLGEKELKIPPKGVVIGRSSTCDVRVDDPQVSRIHSLIYFKDGRYYLKDLDSDNGTFVNGKKISDTVINSGDKIEIGNYSIEFSVLAPERVISKSAILFITIPSLLILLSLLFIFLFKPSIFGLKTGILSIDSEPKEAKVYINDTFKGLTPLKLTLNIGNYKVRLLKENYKEIIQDTKIEENKTTELKFTLEPLTQVAKNGTLEVTSTPDKAKVYINNDYKGDTPLTLKLNIGTYNLKITKSGYQDYTDTIKIEENKILKISPKLSKLSTTPPTTKKIGYLSVNSNPPYADVYIDDKSIGKTPIKSYELNEGSYTIRIMKDGYNEFTKKIDITNGKTTDLGVIKLIPITPVSSETKIIVNFKNIDNKPRVGQYIVIYKQVLDKEGKIVPGDSVTAEKTNNQGQITANVEPGTYMVFTEGPGYGWTIKNVEVKKGETKTVDMILGRLILDFGKDRAFENIRIGDEGYSWIGSLFFNVKLDSEGKLIVDLTPGRYDIITEKGKFENVVIVEGKITKCDGQTVFPPTPP